MLKEIGVDVLHDGARQIMKEHGADVREGTERVRFDADMILESDQSTAQPNSRCMRETPRTMCASAATT